MISKRVVGSVANIPTRYVMIPLNQQSRLGTVASIVCDYCNWENILQLDEKELGNIYGSTFEFNANRGDLVENYINIFALVCYSTNRQIGWHQAAKYFAKAVCDLHLQMPKKYQQEAITVILPRREVIGAAFNDIERVLDQLDAKVILYHLQLN